MATYIEYIFNDDRNTVDKGPSHLYSLKLRRNLPPPITVEEVKYTIRNRIEIERSGWHSFSTAYTIQAKYQMIGLNQNLLHYLKSPILWNAMMIIELISFMSETLEFGCTQRLLENLRIVRYTSKLTS